MNWYVVSFVYSVLGLETDQVWYKCVSQDPPSLAEFIFGAGILLGDLRASPLGPQHWISPPLWCFGELSWSPWCLSSRLGDRSQCSRLSSSRFCL